MQPSRPSVWLQLYFVLASLLGLVLIVIGASTYLTTTLTQHYFKPVPPERPMPPAPYVNEEALRMIEDKNLSADSETEVAYQSWRSDYKMWQQDQQESPYDWEAENRKRTMAWSLAMLIVGAPVFLIHAPFIFIKMKSMA